MARAVHYPGAIKWSAVRGQIIRIPGTVGIAWLVLDAPLVHETRARLVSLPHGEIEELPWGTLRSWLQRGEFEVMDPMQAACTLAHVVLENLV